MRDAARILQGGGNGVLYGCNPNAAGPVPAEPVVLEKVVGQRPSAAQTQDYHHDRHGHRSKSFEVIGTPVFDKNRINTVVTQTPSIITARAC